MMIMMMMMIIIIIMVPRSIHELRAVISLLDYLMDRVLLRMCEVPRRNVFCCLGSFCCSVSAHLLDKTKSSSDHWDSCCFQSPCFLNFYLKIFVLHEFFHCFQEGVVCDQTGSLFVFHYYVWSVCFYLLSC